MKNSLLTFYLSVLILFQLNAQDKPFVFGVEISPGVSWLNTENSFYSSEGAVFSFNYGLSMDFYFHKNYALSTGIQVLSWGGNASYPDLYPFGESEELQPVRSFSNYKYTAFQIPVYLKLKTNPIGYNSYFADFGFSFLFPFKSTITTHSDFTDGKSVDRQTQSIMDKTVFASVNLLLGVGIELPISGNTNAQIALRFLNGITSLSNGNAFKTDGDGNVSITEIENGGQPTGKKLVYNLKGLYLTFRVVF